MIDATAEQDPFHVTRREHDDAWTMAIDLHSLPVSDDYITVELLGSAAVVAVDAPGRKAEFDVEMPGPDATISRRNGVVVIEGTD